MKYNMTYTTSADPTECTRIWNAC